MLFVYTPKVEVVEVRRVMDYREWLLVGMERYWGNHSQPHQFMFKRIGGAAKMFYRYGSYSLYCDLLNSKLQCCSNT
jgi:hypothetical protein